MDQTEKKQMTSSTAVQGRVKEHTHTQPFTTHTHTHTVFHKTHGVCVCVRMNRTHSQTTLLDSAVASFKSVIAFQAYE